jgi:hypothetical protein
MFCPKCECEFRPGFNRCQACDVDLVERLDSSDHDEVKAPEASMIPVPMAEVCGFLDLVEARHVRDRVHREGIAAEILIRASPDTRPGGDVVEEYWLRAEAQQIRRVQALLDGNPEAEAQGDFKCSNCARPVRKEESFCANCGLRFQE